MPYIDKKLRKELDGDIESLISKLSHEKPGEINYCISKIIWALFEREKRYSTANQLAGVLDCVSKEFYRRKVAPYEDSAIDKNGDLLDSL